MNTLPSTRTSEPESGGGRSAVIGKSVVVKGQLFSREDLYVDGEIEGAVEMAESRLTVGPNGKVSASVRAREIVVVGTIHGNVEALERIEIRKDAKLVGDIKTVRIVIEDNAFFKGSVDIIRPEPKAQPVARPPAAPATEARPATAAAPGEVKR
jgi:cytoskeletal protein CcmA (bactofilin family)